MRQESSAATYSQVYWLGHDWHKSQLALPTTVVPFGAAVSSMRLNAAACAGLPFWQLPGVSAGHLQGCGGATDQAYCGHL